MVVPTPAVEGLNCPPLTPSPLYVPPAGDPCVRVKAASCRQGSSIAANVTVGFSFTVTVVPTEAADVQPSVVTETVYVPAVETVIDGVVAPVDHVFPVADDEVRVTFPSGQKVNGPLALIEGVAGITFTTTVVPAEAGDIQPFSDVVTVYVPAVETVIDALVSPLDHVFPVAEDEVKVTLPPSQKVSAPLALMTGAAGIGLTVTTVSSEAPEVHPAVVTLTVNVPEVETVIDGVVSPVDHVLPVAEDEVNVTFPPSQNVNAPLALMIGVAGAPGSVSDCDSVLEAQPLLNVME